MLPLIDLKCHSNDSLSEHSLDLTAPRQFPSNLTLIYGAVFPLSSIGSHTRTRSMLALRAMNRRRLEAGCWSGTAGSRLPIADAFYGLLFELHPTRLSIILLLLQQY